MTYADLEKTKYEGKPDFTKSHIIDDEVNNARWMYGPKAYKKAQVKEYVLEEIRRKSAHFGFEWPY